MAHFGPLARGSILISLRHGDWGSFTCFRIIDQTRKLQPSEQYQQCLFLSFKGTRD